MQKIILVIVGILLIFGCTSNPQDIQNGNNQTGINTSTTNQNNNSTVKLTMAEVAKHNTASDCWLVVDGNVIEVPKQFAEMHAGGMVIPLCGTDATNAFDSKHSPEAKAKLVNMTIGPLE
jgi:cytochrome b involved in lipid metabolism